MLVPVLMVETALLRLIRPVLAMRFSANPSNKLGREHYLQYAALDGGLNDIDGNSVSWYLCELDIVSCTSGLEVCLYSGLCALKGGLGVLTLSSWFTWGLYFRMKGDSRGHVELA